MKNTQDFIENIVKIDEMGDGSFGHFPFQMFVEKEDGKFEISALSLTGGVEPVYDRVKKAKELGFKKLYLSVDFPKGMDMTSDFVAVFTIEGGETSVVAIPYNTEGGEVYDQITESELLVVVLREFNQLSGGS